MSYSFETERAALLESKDGPLRILETWEKARALAAVSGVFSEGKCYALTGDSFHMLAAVDCLIEYGFLAEVSFTGARQDRVLRATRGVE